MSVKWISVLTICLVLPTGLMTQGQLSRQRPGRDLTAYDRAGPYTVDYEPPYNADKYLGEIRGFLWEHWKERRRGQVIATFFSIEGDTTSSNFFVEPGAKGCWRITIESETMVAALLPKWKKPRAEITREDYDEIQRVESRKDTRLIPIPDGEVRQPQTYRLRLRNSFTNSVRTF